MALSQPLELHFKKNAKGHSLLLVQRADGTETWARLHPGMEVHDLAHVAVEDSLGLSKAFFGLLAEGYTVADFEARRELRPQALLPANLPPESLQTEHLVNLLLTELQIGQPWPDCLAQLAEILAKDNLPTMAGLTPERLAVIRNCLVDLHQRWCNLPQGETLSLTMK